MRSLSKAIHDIRICEVQNKSNKIKYRASRINDVLLKLSVVVSDLLESNDIFRNEIYFEFFCYYYKVIMDALPQNKKSNLYIADINNIRNAFTHDHIKVHMAKNGIIFEDFNGSSNIYYNYFYMNHDGYIDIEKFIETHIVVLIETLSVLYNKSFFSGLSITDTQIHNAVKLVEKIEQTAEFDIEQYDEYLKIRVLIFNSQPSIEKLLEAEKMLVQAKNNIYNIELFHTLKHLGFLFLQKNDLMNADKYLFRAEEIIIPMAQDIPYMEHYKFELFNLLSVLLKEQKKPDCIRYAKKSLENTQGLNKKTLLERYIALANAYSIVNDKSEIDTIYKCMSIFNEAEEQELSGMEQAKATLMNNLLAALICHKRKVSDNILSLIIKFQDDHSVSREIRRNICWNLAKYYLEVKKFSDSKKQFTRYLKSCSKSNEYDIIKCNIYINLIKIIQREQVHQWDKLIISIDNSSITTQEKEELKSWIMHINTVIQNN